MEERMVALVEEGPASLLLRDNKVEGYVPQGACLTPTNESITGDVTTPAKLSLIIFILPHLLGRSEKAANRLIRQSQGFRKSQRIPYSEEAQRKPRLTYQ